MWTIVETGQFKKDLKRYRNQTDKLLALASVLQSLRNTGMVPASNKPHRLAEMEPETRKEDQDINTPNKITKNKKTTS